MAVYKRTYKAYQGAMTPLWSRFSVLSRYGFSTLFESRMFTAYTVICFVPFLIGLGYIYLVNNSAVQALLNAQMGSGAKTSVNNIWFSGFLFFEALMGFVLTAWGAPGMISKDFANQSIQLYLSRPLSRAQYLLGKVSVLASVLSLITWVPALLLFGIEAELRGSGWGWQNLWIAGSIFLASTIYIALVSLLAMAISVLVRWRIAATALLFGVFFMLPAFGLVVNLILRTNLGLLLNLGHMLSLVWANLFRIPLQHVQQGPLAMPLWMAWASLLSFCALSLWILDRRLKAREVERA